MARQAHGENTRTKNAGPPSGKARAAVKATARTSKATAKPAAQALSRFEPKPPSKLARAKVPFPRKNQMPSEGEFLARLPLATGKKFESVRAFLRKQAGVVEELYFYGPKTGWAFRYLRGPHSLATIMIHDDRLMGIVSLDAAAVARIDFESMSEMGQRARRMAHGSPALVWLDLPLDGAGTSDFKVLLKSKLKAVPAQGAGVLPPPTPPPPPPPPARRQRA